MRVLQRKGAELQSDAFLPYGIAFDRDKLVWELNFFAKHFLEAYRGAAEEPSADAPGVASLRARAIDALLEAAEQARRRFAIATKLRVSSSASPRARSLNAGLSPGV